MPHSSRKRLLFLCQTLPYPTDFGVNIRAFHLIRQLAKEYEVTALCFYRKAIRPTRADVEDSVRHLNSIAHTTAFPIPQEHRKSRLIWDHLRSLLMRTVYTYYAYEANDFRKLLSQLVSEIKFDLVHVDSLDLSTYLPVLRGLPVVIDHHNVESQLLRRLADQTRPRLRSWYIRKQADWMRVEERRWCQRIALNLAVSSEDLRTFGSIAPGAPFVTVPNGVDTQAFRPSGAPPESERGLLFLGGYSWFPNRDGMEFFTARILPHLRALAAGTPITWVGRVPEEPRRYFESQFGIEVTGYVDDIRPWVHRAACLIVPLRVGGGTRLKILDAWAMGKAVVSTSLGCEGLEVRDGENILICDDEREFAKSVHNILTNPAERVRIGREARRTATSIYDWDIIGRDLTARYRPLHQ